ncbi:XRE family transcriptional regulator [Streptomyces sp. NPDC101733]|uniref:helix-turn-helix domain-containing protein n=1 Tax=unclassified Streptomyces TaxID=2593676 RepID=UPI00341E678C
MAPQEAHEDPETDLAGVLGAVGPRLRALRRQRGVTLAQLAETTGISLSTLSRLESGGRRPTLELLLPLAKAHRVALDELVGAPETGDPRVRARPFQRHGSTYIPLTRSPGGLQAFKTILPPTQGPPPAEREFGVHEGYEWLYVLSGQLRLLLGEHDLVLGPGEAAEFDTRTPHLFFNAGPRPVEFLSLFGPQGERMHVRAKPTPRTRGPRTEGSRPKEPNPRGRRAADPADRDEPA